MGEIARVTKSMGWRRPIGSAVAILVAPVVLWFYLSLFIGLWTWDAWTDEHFLFYCFAFGWPFALFTMVCFGIPVLIVLEKRGMNGPLARMLGGAVAGGAAYFVMMVGTVAFAWQDFSLPFTLEQLRTFALAAVVGGHCGLAYHAIVRSGSGKTQR